MGLSRRANVARGVQLAATGAGGSFSRHNGLIGDDAIGGFMFFAPTFDFDVVENLAERAAKKALETAILQRRQRSNSFFLVSFQELAAPLIRSGVATNLREPGSIGGFLASPDAVQ